MSVGLYIRDRQLHLPLSSVIEEFKVRKVQGSDVEGVQWWKGQRCRYYKIWIAQAEAVLKLKDIGNPCTGWQEGLPISSCGAKQMEDWKGTWSMLRSDTWKRKSARQGWWNLDLKNLDPVGPAKAEGNLDWAMETRNLFAYLFPALTNVILPTQSNLYMWGFMEDPLCRFCGKKGKMVHILAVCNTAPG